MQTENIKKLEAMELHRNSETGYLNNPVSFNLSGHIRYTKAGRYDNATFDRYVRSALLELEDVLLKKAFELEEEEYQEVKRLAKLEVVNIVAGGINYKRGY